LDRLHIHPLAKHAKEAELETIRSVLNNNQYKLTHIHEKPEKDKRYVHFWIQPD
jgi:hypothetical protein